MERVTGIGGLFFLADDPDGLRRWYATNLGVEPPPQSYGGGVWTQEEGATVFAPFAREHGQESPLGRAGWGINFRVRDLDAMVRQLRANGIDVEVDSEAYPIGRFAQLSDPEGNAVQLWEPV
jgi:catechol 2,3-dioxygenase-like lactoylglutathione lyase family enzyme